MTGGAALCSRATLVIPENVLIPSSAPQPETPCPSDVVALAAFRRGLRHCRHWPWAVNNYEWRFSAKIFGSPMEFEGRRFAVWIEATTLKTLYRHVFSYKNVSYSFSLHFECHDKRINFMTINYADNLFSCSRCGCNWSYTHSIHAVFNVLYVYICVIFYAFRSELI